MNTKNNEENGYDHDLNCVFQILQEMGTHKKRKQRKKKEKKRKEKKVHLRCTWRRFGLLHLKVGGQSICDINTTRVGLGMRISSNLTFEEQQFNVQPI
jgi:hypothetical protein